MANAKEIKSRIVALERDLEKQHGAVSAAEEALAVAFANGKDPVAALDALAGAKAAEASMTRAATIMDRMWFELAVAEYETAVAKLNDEAETRYTEAKGAIEKAIADGLVPVMAKYGITAGGGLLSDFTEGTRELAWQIFNAAAADKQRELGPRPSAPYPRDERGIPRAELASANVGA